MIRVDLRAPIIPPTRRVWRLFPGRSYRFLDDFRDQKVAFLDLPGLELPKGSLSDSPDLLARVVAAQKFAAAVPRKSNIGVEDFNWRKFRHAKATKVSGRLRQAVINFFEVARKGDLIIVPSSLSVGLLRVGEITSKRLHSVEGFHKRRYGAVPIPARRIKWIGSIRESQVSPALSESLRHQHPFSLVEKSLFAEVFAVAYSCFVYGDRHSAVIFNKKNDYLDKDAAFLALISKMAAVYCRVAKEGIEPPSRQATAIALLLNEVPVEYTCSQIIDIHSPGFNRFLSGMPTPLIIAASLGVLVALASSVLPASAEEALSQVEVVNTAAPPDDECTYLVSEATMRLLKAMPIDELRQACEAMRDARGRAGLEPGVDIIAPSDG